MSCDYAELLALQTNQLSNLMSDLDLQLKRFQLLPNKMQEAIDALSDLAITRHLAENNTVRCREPPCPPPTGSLMADHLEVHFDQSWSHDQTVAGVKSRVRGTIPDMLYNAQAEVHSVRFPLGNPSTPHTVLASHTENASNVSSKSPAESYQASQFAVLLGNCQALNAETC